MAFNKGVQSVKSISNTPSFHYVRGVGQHGHGLVQHLDYAGPVQGKMHFILVDAHST